MYYLHIKKNKPLLFVLLLLSFGQPIQTSESVKPFFNVPWSCLPTTINKKHYLMGAAGLGVMLLIISRMKSSKPKNNTNLDTEIVQAIKQAAVIKDSSSQPNPQTTLTGSNNQIPRERRPNPQTTQISDQKHRKKIANPVVKDDVEKTQPFSDDDTTNQNNPEISSLLGDSTLQERMDTHPPTTVPKEEDSPELKKFKEQQLKDAEKSADDLAPQGSQIQTTGQQETDKQETINPVNEFTKNDPVSRPLKADDNTFNRQKQIAHDNLNNALRRFNMLITDSGVRSNSDKAKNTDKTLDQPLQSRIDGASEGSTVNTQSSNFQDIAWKVLDSIHDSEQKQIDNEDENELASSQPEQLFSNSEDEEQNDDVQIEIQPDDSDDQLPTELDDEACLKIYKEVKDNFKNFMSDGWSIKSQYRVLNFCPNAFVKHPKNENPEVKKIALAKQALNASILLNQRVYILIANFITYKIEFGTDVEKAFYRENFLNQDNTINVLKFIERLLIFRPIMFMKSYDEAILHKEDTLKNGSFYPASKKDFFDNLPNDEQNIKKYITYDEMLISALLIPYSDTFPINDGARNHASEQMGFGCYERIAVGVAGLVGSRFERPGLMEYKHIIINPGQNTVANGYGTLDNAQINNREYSCKLNGLQIWAHFYGIDHFKTYEEAQKNSDECIPLYLHQDGKYVHKETDEKLYFDISVQKKRITCILKAFLQHVIQKYQGSEDQVYVSTVGLGSGEWAKIKKSDELLYAPADQPMATLIESLQIQVSQAILEELLTRNEKALDNITDIDFAFFGFTQGPKSYTKNQYNTFEKAFKNAEYTTKDNNNLHYIYKVLIGGKKYINFHLSQRPPFAKFENDDTRKKIETFYPADSNCFPGNELWRGRPTSTGESALVSSTLVGATHNATINPYILKNIRTY